jgi:hypothetical protein
VVVGYIEGYIESNRKGAEKVAAALRDGPVSFSWTEGTTHLDIFMTPTSSIRTVFEAPQTVQRWARSGMVIVGIANIGCFYFDLMSGSEVFGHRYVAEKFGFQYDSQTPKDIATLLTLISATFKSNGRNILV